MPVGGGGAGPDNEPRISDQAPPVWRAPEGPEGTGGLRDRPLRAAGSRVAISRAAGPDGARNTSGAASNKLNRSFRLRRRRGQLAGGPPARTASGRATAHGRTKQPGPAAGSDGARNTSGAASNKLNRSFWLRRRRGRLAGGPPPTGTPSSPAHRTARAAPRTPAAPQAPPQAPPNGEASELLVVLRVLVGLAAVGAAEGVDRSHLLRRQREGENVEVLALALRVTGLGQGHGAELVVPAQDEA